MSRVGAKSSFITKIQRFARDDHTLRYIPVVFALQEVVWLIASAASCLKSQSRLSSPSHKGELRHHSSSLPDFFWGQGIYQPRGLTTGSSFWYDQMLYEHM